MNLKRKLKLFLLGLLSFIILFYKHEPGINVLIFSLIAWLLMVYSESGFSRFKKDRNFWMLSSFVWLTAGAFTFYGDPGSFFALLLCFYSLGIYMTDKTFQPLLYPLLLAYSLGSFIVRVFFIYQWLPLKKRTTGQKIAEPLPSSLSNADDNGASTGPVEQPVLAITAAIPQRDTPLPTPSLAAEGIRQQTEAKLTALQLWCSTWLLPICIILLFVIVYMSSSSLFSDILVRIIPNLDFPMLYFVTIAGFYFLFNFMYLLPIPWFSTLNDKITSWDSPAPAIISGQQDVNRQQFLSRHEKAATLTLSLLIALLLVFILIYSYELYRGIHAARLSQALHEQVNSIILSIVMAVAVIMYYIRPGNLSVTGNKPIESSEHKPDLLHKLAYGWILLNVVLVISAGLHNLAYTSRYGLTHLRIGVYIFLTLCLIGLYFTYVKIRRQRSSAYLIGTMFKIFIATIALNSVINWSAIITRYNLRYMATPDLNYLLLLEYNGLTLTPLIMQDPRYKNDQELKDQVLNKLFWNNTGVKRDWLSSTLYFNFEMHQLKKQGYLKPKKK